MCSLMNCFNYFFYIFSKCPIPLGQSYRNTSEMVKEQEIEVQIMSDDPDRCQTLRYRR